MTEPRPGVTVPIEEWLRAIVRCPLTGTELVDGVGPDGEPELVNTGGSPRLAYPVRGGVPVLLVHEARKV
ncbi:hypothetical protein EXU48_07765 [Occultella glacieicola]|uniref:Trm112 family protein n=1 Tax=Occultella glacieicola TaxID=2518684 RepID=A0ABY2E8I1_9MICO|nr:hypothetical protein [Occultella glacieicola]TDE96121.1 hypothetical protein EXU48_07765 [Occultella glacieicola]